MSLDPNRIIQPAGLANRFKERCRTIPEAPFAFLLGAGASVSARSECHIKSASEMVADWIFGAHCDQVGTRDRLLALEWANASSLGLSSFNKSDLAACFSELFTKTFSKNKEAGRRYIQQEIDGKSPDLGYYLLAHIIAAAPPKLIITTNFDNHAADALSAITAQYPMIVGHEALAGYVESKPTRPTIIKLHRDLFYDPRTHITDTQHLDIQMAQLMAHICNTHPLIVVGYGANDGSLMDVLEKLTPEAFPGGLYWCWYRHGVQISDRITRLLDSHSGYLVPIDGFNELMTMLHETMREEALIKELHTDLIERRTRDRIQLIGKTFVDLKKALVTDSNTGIVNQSPDLKRAQESLIDTVGHAPKNWWQWELKAQDTPAELRADIYEQAIREWPDSPLLKTYYANFLAQQGKDQEYAESLFKSALTSTDSEVVVLGSFAVFLHDVKKSYAEAEKYYQLAIEVEPKDAFLHSRLAQLILDSGGDKDRARHFLERAVELDPDDDQYFVQLADFLAEEGLEPQLADEYYRRAIALAPENAMNLGSYADFLRTQGVEVTKIEDYYQRAIAADPSNSFVIGNFAVFLDKEVHDPDRAEYYFKRAIEIDPGASYTIGRYADFLSREREDLDASEIMHKRAIEADPSNPFALYNYAMFLNESKDDPDRARAAFEQAVSQDEVFPAILISYALFVIARYGDFSSAKDLMLRAVLVSPRDIDSICIFASICLRLQEDLSSVDQFFVTLQSEPPVDPLLLTRYAGFLLASGQLEAGRIVLGDASDLSMSLSSWPDRAELAFYNFLFGVEGHRAVWLRMLSDLVLTKNVQIWDWCLKYVVDQACTIEVENSVWIRRLAEVITGEANANSLEDWSEWQSAKSK